MRVMKMESGKKGGNMAVNFAACSVINNNLTE